MAVLRMTQVTLTLATNGAGVVSGEELEHDANCRADKSASDGVHRATRG